MANPAKLKRASKPVAVIRSYHPIRIERELLAQVFDLAERGFSAGNSGVDRPGLDADPIDDHRTNSSTQHGFRAQGAPQELDQLEAVA